MTASLAHRGPDDVGIWIDANQGVALGHRRLSIIDRSSAGHQPMSSPSGRFVIAFNGEIYNHLDLRADLEPNAWRSQSDTETLLVAIERWGLESATRRAVGMFAFALWDRLERRLVLGRDRIGEKPLYYGRFGRVFAFGSELKALRAHPCFHGDVDRAALGDLLSRGFIQAPRSIYKGISKLLPGTLLFLYPASGRSFVRPYWSLSEVAEQGLRYPFVGTDEEAVDELELRLVQSVRQQRVADVPLGALLSGGVDSSTIVALMQAQSSDPVRTFAIGFQEADYDEGPHALAVAEHLGTKHTGLTITPADAIGVIPTIPSVYDEPIGDVSQIPTLLVSALARRSVTVALSGDGGDEVFGGYPHYRTMPRLWAHVAGLSKFSGLIVRQGLESLGQPWLDPAISFAIGLRGRAVTRPPSARFKSLADGIASGSDLGFSRALTSQWGRMRPVLQDSSGDAALREASGLSAFGLSGSPAERLMLEDSVGYLPDDILTKVDRAAMNFSLETRAPILDHRVVEFAWSLPLNLRIRDDEGKWILRRLLSRYVPRHLTDRPKQGFVLPVGEWLRTSPLRDWAEELLSPSRLHREGFLDPAIIRQCWAQHLSGRYLWHGGLWPALMFEAWLDAERRSPGVPPASDTAEPRFRSDAAGRVGSTNVRILP